MLQRILSWLVILCCILSTINLTPTKATAAHTSIEQGQFTSLKAKNASQKTLKPKFHKKVLINQPETFTIANDISNCEIHFKSSDPELLEVKKTANNSCTYTAKEIGTSYIIVKLKLTNTSWFEKSNYTYKYKITSYPKAVSVKFRKNKYRLSVGDSIAIHVTLRPSITIEKPTFASNNTRICYFDKKNRLVAKSKGTTYITATILNGKKAKCKIIVKK